MVKGDIVTFKKEFVCSITTLKWPVGTKATFDKIVEDHYCLNAKHPKNGNPQLLVIPKSKKPW